MFVLRSWHRHPTTLCRGLYDFGFAFATEALCLRVGLLKIVLCIMERKRRRVDSTKKGGNHRQADLNRRSSSSSEDEDNPYSDLISMIKSGNRSEDSDSESNDEPVIKKRKELSKNPPRDTIGEASQCGDEDHASSDSDESDDDGQADERDCLKDEPDSENDELQDVSAGSIFSEDSDEESEVKSMAHKETDYYKRHLDAKISEHVNALDKVKLQNRYNIDWAVMDKLSYANRVTISGGFVPQKPLSKNSSKEELHSVNHVRKALVDNWLDINKEHSQDGIFTPLQREIFTLVNSYNDVNHVNVNSIGRSPEIMKVLCLHVANHLLRCRAKVLTHTAKLKQMTPEQQDQAEYRDQGITRPRILILVPFRNTALQIVDILLKMFQRGSKFQVGYRKRFYKEFGSEDQDRPSIEDKPVDYQAIFEGNTDEHFRIGIALLRNSVRLYSPFYSSDIIICSPLGLRTVMGSSDEKHYDHDFLSSIEMVVLEQTDVFMMQNWEHVLHIFKHLNIPPKDSHNVNFSRVRHISLDSFNKFYRQTIAMSSTNLPQISSLFSRFCFNHQGLLTAELCRDSGSICAIAKQIPQVFHKLMPPTLVDSAEVRFKFFVDKIYRQYKESKMTHTLVYVPQYYDFVRLRNFMRTEWKNGSGPIFAHINDYSTSTEAGKAKRRFYTGKCPIMLYTERYHFYNRNKIRGMRNLVFYELPTFSRFYSELCNMVRESGDASASMSVIALYTKYDCYKLAATIGIARGKEMLSSNKTVHMFVTNS